MMKSFKKEILLILLVAGQLLILIKSQFTAWPEMLSYPYLMINGFLNYQDIINPYPPILPQFLSLYYKAVGLGLIQLKIITYITIIVSDLLIFLISKKYNSFRNAVAAVLIYIPLQIVFEGNGLWFDLFITPVYLLLYLVSLKIVRQKHSSFYTVGLFGLIFGIALLIKQTSVFLLILVVFYFLLNNIVFRNFKAAFYFLFFLLIPFFVTIHLTILNKTFEHFYYWVFKYPYIHIQSQGFLLFPTIKQLAILMLFLIITLIQVLINKNSKKIQLLFLFFIASLFFSIPRFSFFHLQPAIPFFALLFSFSSADRNKKMALYAKTSVIMLTLLVFVLYYPKYFNKQPRFYDNKTVDESGILGSQLRNKGPVLFYNVSSEYFVIGNLFPVKPWADTFPWYLESQGLQERMVESLNSPDVQFVVKRKFNNEGKFVPGSYVPENLDRFISDNFKNIGTVNNNIWILEKKYSQ